MIIDSFLNVFFAVVGWVLSFLPGGTIQALATNTLNIYGYGVWILGGVFFDILCSLIVTEIGLSFAFNLVRFIINIVRGSGA